MREIKLKGIYNDSLIYIEKGLLRKAGSICLENTDVGKVCIITDSNVSPIYLDTLEKSFPEELDIISLNVPAGEEYKHLLTIKEIYKVLADSDFIRTDMIIALGGGVVGDMAGFVAATYLRGVEHFIQIPTTLLAQVDSSIGGKCGVDLPQGKNFVGAFKQPEKVLVDGRLLVSLPRKVFEEGMAEVIKYGLIKDATILRDVSMYNYFDDLIQNINFDRLENLLEKCISIKANLVEIDELDKGERRVLNFGHTVGHALEKIGNYKAITHGAAVSVGLVFALAIGERRGKTKKGTKESVVKLLEMYNLPTTSLCSAELIYQAVLNDKKREKEGISIVYVIEPGKADIVKIGFEELHSELVALLEN